VINSRRRLRNERRRTPQNGSLVVGGENGIAPQPPAFRGPLGSVGLRAAASFGQKEEIGSGVTEERRETLQALLWVPKPLNIGGGDGKTVYHWEDEGVTSLGPSKSMSCCLPSEIGRADGRSAADAGPRDGWLSLSFSSSPSVSDSTTRGRLAEPAEAVRSEPRLDVFAVIDGGELPEATRSSCQQRYQWWERTRRAQVSQALRGSMRWTELGPQDDQVEKAGQVEARDGWAGGPGGQKLIAAHSRVGMRSTGAASRG
jgi:hypothetical protein